MVVPFVLVFVVLGVQGIIESVSGLSLRGATIATATIVPLNQNYQIILATTQHFAEGATVAVYHICAIIPTLSIAKERIFLFDHR